MRAIQQPTELHHAHAEVLGTISRSSHSARTPWAAREVRDLEHGAPSPSRAASSRAASSRAASSRAASSRAASSRAASSRAASSRWACVRRCGLALSLCGLALALGCGDDDPPTARPGDFWMRVEVDPPIVTVDNDALGASLATAWVDQVEGDPIAVRVDRWWLSSDRAATVDADGVIRATGRAGGAVRVFAELDLGEGRRGFGEGVFRVEVRRDVLVSEGAAPALVRILDETPVADDVVGPQLLAPLDGAIMPADVSPPEVHWDPTRPGDTLRVRALADGVEVRAYLVHEGPGFPDAWGLDARSWAILAETASAPGLRAPGGDGRVTFVVERFVRGAPAGLRGAPVHVRLSREGLHGALAYWEVQTDPATSRLARLDLSTGAREPLAVGARDCSGCHAVAHDGRTLAATLDLEASALVDLSTGVATELDGIYDAFAFAPSGDRILASERDEPTSWPAGPSRLTLLDARGAPMEASGLPTEVASSPAWSPDGSLIAWVRGGTDHPDGTDEATDLVVQPVTETGFGEPRVLVEGASLEAEPEGGRTITRPSFGPGGELVVFAHGTASGSRPDVTSAIYVAHVGRGDVARLEVGMGPEGDGVAFWPTFLPMETRELDGARRQWVVFYSRAPFGNARAGTRASGERQLWMMGIDPDRITSDPSLVPFRLSGQLTRRHAMAGQWIAGACGDEGDSCRVSADCCAGHCEDAVCVVPECVPLGGECGGVVGCCGDAECDPRSFTCTEPLR
ncbi:MAG: PD40 domain-containing protein [Myxococcales bacterium]|nr:PD40 domain-containing protein [Myxococcales bacterium]